MYMYLVHVHVSISRRAWIHCQTTDKKVGASSYFAFSAHSQQQHAEFWRALHEYVNLGR